MVVELPLPLLHFWIVTQAPPFGAGWTILREPDPVRGSGGGVKAPRIMLRPLPIIGALPPIMPGPRATGLPVLTPRLCSFARAFWPHLLL